MGSPVNKRPDPWAPSSLAPDGEGLVDAGAVDVEGPGGTGGIYFSHDILVGVDLTGNHVRQSDGLTRRSKFRT